MTESPSTVEIVWAVFRLGLNNHGRPACISRGFKTEDQAERYRAELPKDWQTVVQRVVT